MKIPISKPYFGEEERRALMQPLETGWVVQGPQVAEFESRFANYTNLPNPIATTSCTTALHLALIALDIGPGDEVLVPAFTWVATANVVEMQGARPVFVDIELDTFNIDLFKIESCITSRTKAIIPVSLFGISAPMKPIIELAKSYNLKVVEDDACAVGAKYQERHAGALADIACFSFHPRKAITTGEGGMVTTSSELMTDRIRSLRDHGASKSDLVRHLGNRSYLLPEFNQVGYNYRMTDLQGAIGVVQLERLPWILEQRRRIAKKYDEALRGHPYLRPPVVPPDCQHGYQAYVTMFQPEPPTIANVTRLNIQRNKLMDKLEAADIATRPGTHAVHMLGYYSQKYSLRPEDFPSAYLADQLTLTLPLYPQMTEPEQSYVIDHMTGVERYL